MARVHRKGTAAQARQAAKRDRRKCRSAPAVPTGVALTFHRRRTIGAAEALRARVAWDAVTDDVAGRALNVESYQVQLRATDASGDPVETQLQAQAAQADGADFTVHSGSAAVNKTSRELDASPDVIKKTLTGLTTGISAVVNFYARKDAGASAPVLKFEIWNVTDGVSVGSKNETVPSQFVPRLLVTRDVMPVADKTYEARVSWVSGSGVALFDHIQWHDKGAAAVWRRNVAADDEPLDAVFPDLARPRSWYYQARVRVLNRTHGHRCWSAWSAWTTPTNPAYGATPGPPVPTAVTLVLDKVEGSRPRPWRAKVRWNEVPWWVPPDDDPVLGAAGYHIQLAVSNDGGTTTANVRRKTVEADDSDGNQTANAQFLANIRGKRHYRARVKAYDEQGRRSAWSSWTAWASPGGEPDPPTGLTWSNPTPRLLVARWTEPADLTDVDRYLVTVLRQPGAVVVDTGYTPGTRWVYHIPYADRNNAHRVRVKSLEDEIVLDVDEDTPLGWEGPTESTEVDSSDVTADALLTAPEIDIANSTLLTAYEAAGYCAVRAYNDNGTARTFGYGLTYNGVSSLTNVPSSITFALVGTDVGVSSPTAFDISLQGFGFRMTVDGNSTGEGARTYQTVGN